MNNNIRQVKREIQPDGSVKVIFHDTKTEPIKESVKDNQNRYDTNKNQQKPEEKKPLRYTHDNLTKDLIGKNVSISLLNKESVNGKIAEVGVYDITLEGDNNGYYIILKSAISTILVIK